MNLATPASEVELPFWFDFLKKAILDGDVKTFMELKIELGDEVFSQLRNMRDEADKTLSSYCRDVESEYSNLHTRTVGIANYYGKNRETRLPIAHNTAEQLASIYKIAKFL